ACARAATRSRGVANARLRRGAVCCGAACRSPRRRPAPPHRLHSALCISWFAPVLAFDVGECSSPPVAYAPGSPFDYAPDWPFDYAADWPFDYAAGWPWVAGACAGFSTTYSTGTMNSVNTV